jgi:hypothetical protein
VTVAPIVAAEVLFGSVRTQCNARSINHSMTAETLDSTTFCSGGWEEYVAGLKSGSLSFDGFADFTAITNGIAVDKELFDNLGSAGAPVSVAVPAAGATAVVVGDPAYTSRSLAAGFSTFGAVGELTPIEADIETTGLVARGAILHTTAAAETTTGTATGAQLGALSSTQSLYVALHVVAAVTGTVTVKVQSDDNSGFTSATDRLTFTSAGSAGWQWGTVAGAITDTWWRAQWTVAGGGSYTFAVVAGIA